MTLKNQDRTMFGTKVYNHETKEYGLVIYTWTNTYSKNGGGIVEVPFATCVDENGKKYNTAMDNITPVEE